MSHTFKSTAIWHDSAGNECECEVIVEYDRYTGFDGDRINPPEEARVEVIGITPVIAEYDIPANAIDLDAYAEDCMADWTDDAIAAAESRADARRDDAMMERF